MWWISSSIGCFRTTKIQNLRAIHNRTVVVPDVCNVVSGRQRYKIWEQFTTTDLDVISREELFQDDKDTKFESNSQHQFVYFFCFFGCFRTTKIQNLRAIHNQDLTIKGTSNVVSGRQRYKIWEQFTTGLPFWVQGKALFQDDKDTKFESNSQQRLLCLIESRGCFRTTKIQNLRAIHNRRSQQSTWRHVVSGRQRYKIWEQFTTTGRPW